jgi:hypothetical protein
MISSLYLDGRARQVSVGLYGTALELAGEGEPPRLAPLVHLRRICCWGRVHWAGEALIACAARAIPICFLGHGRGIGYFLPARPAAKCFSALIDDARLHPLWTERLLDWEASEFRRSLLAVVEGRDGAWTFVKALLDAGDPRLALRTGLRLAAPAAPWRPVWRNLNECLHAWTIQQLLSQPLALPDLANSSDRPNLTQKLTLVISPLLLQAAVNQAVIERNRKTPRGPAAMTGTGSLAHRCAVAFSALEPRLARFFWPALRRFESLVRTCAEDFEPV